MMYGVNETGVYIQSVTSGSEAESSGFSRGDRIVSVDGTEVSTSSEFDAIIKEHSVGDAVSITISRNGKQATLSLVLEESIPTTYGSNSTGNSNGNGYYNGGFGNYFNDIY